MKKRLIELEKLSPAARRRFIKLGAIALAAPGIPLALRYGFNDFLGGTAHAQSMEAALPTRFIEINYRDQVDLGEVFVAPGLATKSNLVRGESGRRCAMFVQQADLRQFANNVYLTPDSMVLQPHLDNIAMVDTNEMTPGAIHYHQAANRTRMPDAGYDRSGGRLAVFNNDKISNFPQGCEEFYATMPSPASLHNFVQKTMTADGARLRNGVALKGISRSIHTVYHFGAGLAGAELDRMQSKQQLISAFAGAQAGAASTLPTADEAELFARVLGRIDPRFLQSRRYGTAASDSHVRNVADARALLHAPQAAPLNLALTDAEIQYWRTGVPEAGRYTVDGQDGRPDPNAVPFQIWEQYAFAHKLIASGVSRSVALECEFIDIHDRRPRNQMTIHTQQLALPLARLIDSLKRDNLWDRTLIAVYTLDGSRSPAAGSSGDEGKNSVMLAGGMIRGGYYGDVLTTRDMTDGHEYGYRAPDPVTGAPGPLRNDNSGRLAGGHMWSTVMRALGVPASVTSRFSVAANVATLPYLLRS